MASHFQHDEFSNCAFLPCIGDRSQPEKRNLQPNPLRNGINAKHSEMKQTEDLLASELNKLSVQERAEASDDLHCVGEELKETPEMIERSLAAFEAAVKKQRNPIYDMACNQNRAYVEDSSFRLMFLRAKLYDVDKAVGQMMHFLHYKATYFGNDKVARDITLDDLNEGDMEVLMSGYFHIQEGEDRTGRLIIHAFVDMIGRWKAENTIRASYIVFFNILLQHQVVQRRGLVSICHNISRPGNRFRMPGIDDLLKMSNFALCVPIRYTAMHYCVVAGRAGLKGNDLLGMAWNAVPKYSRVRGRVHVGSIMELQYQLRSHGIPSDTFPIDIHGDIRQDILNMWFYKYRQEQNDGNRLGSENDETMSILSSSQQTMETHQLVNQLGSPTAKLNVSTKPAAKGSSAAAKSFVASEKDVLLGRGRFAQSWVGNVKFREFIDAYSDEYDRLSRIERQRRTSELTQELIARGFRFFKHEETSGEWVEADFAESRQRVSQMFRTLRKKNHR